MATLTILDVDQLAEVLARSCQHRGIKLAVAESCTGGGVAEAITRIGGSSSWFERGFVAYSDAAKVELLGVSLQTLHRHGAVSEAVACEMAAGALRRSAASASVAVTGIAGPGGGTPGKPVGLVWIAWKAKKEPAQARSFRFLGERQSIRRQAILVCLQGLIDLMGQES